MAAPLNPYDIGTAGWNSFNATYAANQANLAQPGSSQYGWYANPTLAGQGSGAGLQPGVFNATGYGNTSGWNGVDNPVPGAADSGGATHSPMLAGGQRSLPTFAPNPVTPAAAAPPALAGSSTYPSAGSVGSAGSAGGAGTAGSARADLSSYVPNIGTGIAPPASHSRIPGALAGTPTAPVVAPAAAAPVAPIVTDPTRMGRNALSGGTVAPAAPVQVPKYTAPGAATTPAGASNTGMGGATNDGSNLPPGYFMSTASGQSQPVASPTFATYWAQRLEALQNPAVNPAAFVAGIVGPGGSTDAMLTPAAQYAKDYAAIHGDDPAIAAAGGIDAFIQSYNTPQYSLSALRPDYAAVANGWGSGGNGTWGGLNDAGLKLLTGGGYGQPAFDASPQQIADSLRLNGISSTSPYYSQQLGIANSNLGQMNGANSTGATALTIPQALAGAATNPVAPASNPATNPNSTTTPATTQPAGSDVLQQLFLRYLLSQLQGPTGSTVQQTPLGYTQYAPNNQSSMDPTTLLLLMAMLGGQGSGTTRTNFWGL